MGEEISRRELLRGFHRLIGRTVSEFGKSVQKEFPSRGRAVAPETADLSLPGFGAPLEGIPFVHPFIGLARAVGERHGRRVPYVLLLGGSGEAFRIAWCRNDAERALRQAPINPFLAALAISGLSANATHGGGFEAGVGGIEVALGKGKSVVVGGRSGPGAVLAVSRKTREVDWVQAAGGMKRSAFDEFEAEWREGWWSAGSAPNLRITVERGAAPRPLDDVMRVGLETMVMLLSREGSGEMAEGLEAWEACEADLRDGKLPKAGLEVQLGEWLTTVGVARQAAGRFLEAIGRAVPPDEREPLEAAVREYREIHNPDPTGDVWGTGLLPEVAECLQTDGRADPEKYADPALRARAADLIAEVRSRETAALAHIRRLPESRRTLGG